MLYLVHSVGFHPTPLYGSFAGLRPAPRSEGFAGLRPAPCQTFLKKSLDQKTFKVYDFVFGTLFREKGFQTSQKALGGFSFLAFPKEDALRFIPPSHEGGSFFARGVGCTWFPQKCLLLLRAGSPSRLRRQPPPGVGLFFPFLGRPEKRNIVSPLFCHRSIKRGSEPPSRNSSLPFSLRLDGNE